MSGECLGQMFGSTAPRCDGLHACQSNVPHVVSVMVSVSGHVGQPNRDFTHYRRNPSVLCIEVMTQCHDAENLGKAVSG
jgi:hypothetical protein